MLCSITKDLYCIFLRFCFIVDYFIVRSMQNNIVMLNKNVLTRKLVIKYIYKTNNLVNLLQRNQMNNVLINFIH